MEMNLTISSSTTLLSFCLQAFPASGSLPLSQLFVSGGRNIGASALASVFPMNVQDWFPLGLTGLISCCPRDSLESSPAPQFKSINSSVLRLLYGPTLTSLHDYWKNHSLDYIHLCWQRMSLLFSMLFRFVIAFLPRSNCLKFMAAFTICDDFGTTKIKSVTVLMYSFPIWNQSIVPGPVLC